MRMKRVLNSYMKSYIRPMQNENLYPNIEEYLIYNNELSQDDDSPGSVCHRSPFER